MKRLGTARFLLFSLLACASPVAAQSQWIVSVNPSSLAGVEQQVRLASWNVLDAAHGLCVVTLPGGLSGAIALAALQANPLVTGIEPDQVVNLPEADSSYNPGGHSVPPLASYIGPFTLPGGVLPWGPYLNQPANTIVSLPQAQQAYGYGGGVVAVIDTGVDYTHPVLAPFINFWQGKDFTGSNDVTGNSDLQSNQEVSPVVDQETSLVVDGSGTIIVNQEVSPVVDQEVSPVVDSNMPADFGHGTMVAGIVHLVAPFARMIPIKAFSSNGTGNLSNIIAAIYYAADQGSTVINMSFGGPQDSKMLQQAIAYANSLGAVAVAAVANDDSAALQYPAADTAVIGVASINDQGYRSSFSDWGADVTLAAPGEAIVSTYPFNQYAIGWGTSFATPYVTGTVALLQSLRPGLSPAQITTDLAAGAAAVNSPGLGAGMLDVYGSAARTQ